MHTPCQCQAFSINAAVSGAARLVTHDTVETLIVPVTAIVEGVLNGVYVPAEEFGAVPTAWEGAAIPVNHPVVNGANVSANTPEIIASHVIGRYHNVTLDGNALRGELWIDVAAAIRKGFEAVVNRLKAGEKVEVSTAYFSTHEDRAGTFNGVPYTKIARQIKPDHLAILPNSIGACSVEQGCGTFNTNSGVAMLWDKIKRALGFDANEASYGDRRQLVSDALNVGGNFDCYIVDMYDDRIVYEYGGSLYQRPYTIDETTGTVTLGDAAAVVVEKSYVPVTTNEQEAAPVADQEFKLDAHSQAAVDWARSQFDAEQNRLVARLIANKSNKFDESELRALPMATLSKMDASLNTNAADYSGRGAPVQAAVVDTNVEALEIPRVITEGV